jgi:hypothetical protein
MPSKPKFGDNEKLKKGTGAYKRTRRRAKKAGEWKDIRKGGVTGAEARSVRPSKPGGQGGANKGGANARARERQDYLREHGGAVGVKGKIDTKPERQRIKRAYYQETRNDPLQPRGGRALVREANALTNVEYAPYESQLNEQRRNIAGREKVLYGPGGWMEGYRNDVAAAAQRQQTAELAFQAGANAQMLQANQAFQQQTAATNAGAPGQSAGGQVSGDIQAQQQQAAAGRMQMAQNAATQLATRGASNIANVNAMAIAAAQQAQEGLMESQARMARVDTLAQELAREKGAFNVAQRGKLKEGERTYELNRQAFGLDVAKAKADIADDRADNRRDARADRKAAARTKLLNKQTRESIKTSKGKRALDKQADLADDGKRNNSTNYSEWAQRTRPDKGDGSSGVKGDTDGDGVADRGKYKGFSESERDKFDSAITQMKTLERKEYRTKSGKKVGGPGYVRANRETMISSLVEKGVPLRIAKRAVRRYLRSTGGKPVGNAISEAGKDYPG